MLRLLGESLFNYVKSISGGGRLNEIRLRSGKPVSVTVDGVLKKGDYMVSTQEIERVVSIAGEYSLYACGDMLVKGYLPYLNGIRVGVCGEGVVENGKIIAQRNINSLAIRIPNDIQALPAEVRDRIKSGDSILFAAPPGNGKTTLLRAVCRAVSAENKNVLVIDERNELSATNNGECGYELGVHADVAVRVPKSVVYDNLIRSMSPQAIVTDEVFTDEEVNCVKDCLRCNITVYASVHGNVRSLKKSELFSDLLDCFDAVVELGAVGKPGKVTAIYSRAH